MRCRTGVAVECGDGVDVMFRWLSLAFGLLMVAATGVSPQHQPAFVTAMLAIAAVLAGTVFRPAATLAVTLTVVIIAVEGPSPLFAAVSGLAATLYLLLRHAQGGVMTTSAPTIIAALGFAVTGLAATWFPLRLPWLPLIAPVAVLGAYLLAVRPFVGDRS